MWLLVLSLSALLAANDVLARPVCSGNCLEGIPEDALMNEVMPLKKKEWQHCQEERLCPLRRSSTSAVPCKDGDANGYPCKAIDLLSFVSLADMGSGGDGNDIWGWSGMFDGVRHNIAIFCAEDGTSFVDVTNPREPRVLGFADTNTYSSLWRDAKTFGDYVFIVSEARDHGMQVVNVRQLVEGSYHISPVTHANYSVKAVPHVPVVTVYGQFGSAHNIVINEESGFAYAVGTTTCRGGLHIVDINEPTTPVYAGCYSADGYTHDAQCVMYNGKDGDYQGREICFAYNEDTLTIVDVTDKNKPAMISRTPYEFSRYCHQGWLLPGTEQSKLLMNDELDEMYGSVPAPNTRHTRTMLWDVSDLDSPSYELAYYAEQKVIDHNLYIVGSKAYLANYEAGLRVLDIDLHDKANPLVETAFFDVHNEAADKTEFFGAWSSYPFFSGSDAPVIVSSIELGLFVLTKPVQ